MKHTHYFRLTDGCKYVSTTKSIWRAAGSQPYLRARVDYSTSPPTLRSEDSWTAAMQALALPQVIVDGVLYQRNPDGYYINLFP